MTTNQQSFYAKIGFAMNASTTMVLLQPPRSLKTTQDSGCE
jgi:hypothetical protein